MITLNGHSTSVVKLQLESVIYANLGIIGDVGSFVVSSPGSGTYEAADTDYEIPTAGKDLVVRTTAPIESESNMVVTVTGTAFGGGAITAVATILAGAAEGQAYNLEPTVEGKKFLTVTDVTVTNGVAGDGFEICALPDEADDEVISYDQGLTINPGKEVKPIYDKYDLAHNKRIRGDRTMSLSAFYVNNKTGLARLNNREMTLIQKFFDDGGNTATETVYIDKCRLGITRESPSADDGEVTVKGEGSYGRLFIFS